MWVLVSHGGKIIGDPAKSESAMAKRLGISRQFLNKQLKKRKKLFHIQGNSGFSPEANGIFRSGTRI